MYRMELGIVSHDQPRYISDLSEVTGCNTALASPNAKIGVRAEAARICSSIGRCEGAIVRFGFDHFCFSVRARTKS